MWDKGHGDRIDELCRFGMPPHTIIWGHHLICSAHGDHWVCSTQRAPLGMQYSEDTTGYAVLRGHHWVCSAQSGPLGIQCSQCSGGTTGYAVLRGDHWVCSAQGGPLGMLGMQCSEDTTGYAILRGDHWVYAVRGHHWVCTMQYSGGTTGYMQCSGGTTGYMGGPVYEVLRGHAGLICMQRIIMFIVTLPWHGKALSTHTLAVLVL